MKSGVCPKCKSEEVYIDSLGNHGIVIPLGIIAGHTVHLYVCADCGYLEFYAQTGHDLSRVKEKVRKVKV